MADKKISALTAATTPLAGTEVVPLVQSGVTKKVAVSDLTAGRAVSTGALTASGNLRTEYSAAGNVSVIANNTNTTAGATSQVIALNDASRGLRIQYSSSGGFGGNAIVNGVSTEAGQIFTDNGFPLVLGVGGFATAILDTSSNFNIKSGNLIIGTAGKGITTDVANGNINLIPIGTGKVFSATGSSFNSISTERKSKSVAKSGTGVLTITPVTTINTHASVRVDINVSYGGNSNLQFHAGYLVLTCNETTAGGGTAIAEYYNASVGNFSVTTANFVVTRPGSGNIVITYTNTNVDTTANNVEFAVTGLFNTATIA